MGATDGNIMAASITTHVATKKPSGPGSVQRPMSIPLSWVDVKIQLTAARTSRMATRPASRGSIRDAGPSRGDGPRSLPGTENAAALQRRLRAQRARASVNSFLCYIGRRT